MHHDADANATAPGEDTICPRVIPGTDPLGPVLERLAALAQFLAPRAAVNDKMLATVDTAGLAWDYAASSTVRVLAQCARDRTAAECDRCLEYSARVAASCCWGWGLDHWHDGVAGAVLSFNCYLRFEVSTVSVPLRERIAMVIIDYPTTTALLAAVVVVLVVKIGRKIRTVNNARNAAASAAAADRQAC